MICSMCDTKFHLTAEHESLIFNNEDEFTLWRRAIEADHKVKYVGVTLKKSSDKSIVYYVCNRSGQPRFRVKEETRKRHLKLKGSKKTGVQCLSKITMTVSNNGAVAVDFCKTHSGHANDLKHLLIPSPKKKEIAARMSAKVPTDVILEEVRGDALNSNNDLMHEHLITDLLCRCLFNQVGEEAESSLESSTCNHQSATPELDDAQKNPETKALLGSFQQSETTVHKDLRN
ncbi:hypothetical protein GE061_017090 [Apolygus lucorum]|uniref:Uncharacterized protein n=1 Tax=Apolygus lucorum TaxID=248454 RepID=A0A8S9XI09_APOLU|nr:hypothetical protein GE061_017090 [Apolygus lucorum]